MSVLPLRQAYAFMAANEIDEIDLIRSLPNKSGYRYMSGARRGLFISTMNEKGLLDQFLSEYWPEGTTSAGQRMIQTHLRRYDDYLEIDGESAEEIFSDDDVEASSFAYEADLQRFLAKNLALIEPGLQLYNDEAGAGIEYPVDGGRIDILAVDRNDEFVVIELKLSRGRNKALGQILYYMGWVDENLGVSAPCRGIIVSRDVSDQLALACKRTPGLTLFEYELQVTLKQVEL